MWLDIGCGTHKTAGAVGMDKRPLDGVDVVHDAEVLPYPFEKETFDRIVLSHLVEHLKPWLLIEIMNELWRIVKLGGQVLIATPYAGSFGFHQDPTHMHGWNEATPQYFDPDYPLYEVYEASPWKIVQNLWRDGGSLEVVLEKRARVYRPAATGSVS